MNKGFSKAGKSTFFEAQNLIKETVFYPIFPPLWIIAELLELLIYNKPLALGGINFRLLSTTKENP
ncbi:hypothetical protein [Terrimonas alba]|uniref:hypothetical protein n=1 Tax=Terrimonas alba TaxID=3349636 RepID=UPI0035F3ADEE